MVAVGFVSALSALQWANSSLLTMIGNLVDLLPPVMILHVFLAFPSGRLGRRPEQVVVVAGYTIALVLQLAKRLFGIDPGSPLDVFGNLEAAVQLERAQLSALSALLLAGVVLLAIRRHRMGRPSRRPAALLIDAFGLGLVMLALLLIAGMLGWASFETIRHVTYGVLGLAPAAFLLGLLDARLARSDVGAMLVELRGDPARDLQGALARAMHDHSLTLAYWLPQFGSWADQVGRPITLPEPGSGRATKLIYRDGEPMAALVFDPSLEDERELLDGIGAAAGIALENGRLHAELRARLQELQGSRTRVLEAGQEERKRLERNLHDGAQQRLVALSLELGLLEGSLVGDTAAKTRLARAKHEVAESLEELRAVARGIYPAVLSGHGLSVALESLAARSTVPVTLDVRVEGRLPERVEVAAYYVACESLANLGKHAHATGANVTIAFSGDWLVVEVEDDGVGGADTEQGSGLRGLADRVEAAGGELRIWSPAGSGTRLQARMPCR
jgi:signal transduction histidine kinase